MSKIYTVKMYQTLVDEREYEADSEDEAIEFGLEGSDNGWDALDPEEICDSDTFVTKVQHEDGTIEKFPEPEPEESICSFAKRLANIDGNGMDDEQFAEFFVYLYKYQKSRGEDNQPCNRDDMNNFPVDNMVAWLKDTLTEIIFDKDTDSSAWWKRKPDDKMIFCEERHGECNC